MKLTIDPMVALRAAAKIRVNEGFGSTYQGQVHLDAAYAQKRVWAETDRAKLGPEAEIRGVTIDELAESILSKPDLVAARELDRQRFMKLIDTAQVPEDLTPEGLSVRKEAIQ